MVKMFSRSLAASPSRGVMRTHSPGGSESEDSLEEDQHQASFDVTFLRPRRYGGVHEVQRNTDHQLEGRRESFFGDDEIDEDVEDDIITVHNDFTSGNMLNLSQNDLRDTDDDNTSSAGTRSNAESVLDFLGLKTGSSKRASSRLSKVIQVKPCGEGGDDQEDDDSFDQKSIYSARSEGAQRVSSSSSKVVRSKSFNYGSHLRPSNSSNGFIPKQLTSSQRINSVGENIGGVPAGGRGLSGTPMPSPKSEARKKFIM